MDCWAFHCYVANSVSASANSSMLDDANSMSGIRTEPWIQLQPHTSGDASFKDLDSDSDSYMDAFDSADVESTWHREASRIPFLSVSFFTLVQ